MERTITQNGALYALQHGASTQQRKAQIKRAHAREKIPPPRTDLNTVTNHKFETEDSCFISSGTSSLA